MNRSRLFIPEGFIEYDVVKLVTCYRISSLYVCLGRIAGGQGFS